MIVLLEPIYEKDFLDCSYGFRPRRSSHQALDALPEVLKGMNGGWVLDVDIRKYFDSIPHSQLLEILRHRVKDKVILRLLSKWLRAGVWENGVLTVNDDGIPQGGVVSPLLSNIYLHTVLDVWFEQVVCPRLKGVWSLAIFEAQAEALRQASAGQKLTSTAVHGSPKRRVGTWHATKERLA